MRLTPEQKEIIDNRDHAMYIERRPKTGVGTALVERARRIASTSSGRILMLTFLRRTRLDYRQRMAAYPELKNRVTVGLFQEFCQEVIANQGKFIGIDQMPDVLSAIERKVAFLGAVWDDPLGRFKDFTVEKVTDMLNRIIKAKTQFRLADMEKDEQLRRANELYEAELRSMQAIDEDDQALLVYRIFRERPGLAEFYRMRYRHVWVNHAEMLNAAQYQVILALCGEGYPHAIFVGYPKRKSASDNKSDRPNPFDVKKRFEENFGAKLVEMKTFFSTSRAIMEAIQSISKDYTGTPASQGTDFIEGEVRLFVGSDEQDEARVVYEQLLTLDAKGHPALENGFSLGRCAVVGRNRYVLQPLQERLQKQQVPYIFHRRLQRDSGLAEQFRLSLQLLNNPSDQRARQRLCWYWDVPVSEDDYKGEDGYELIRSIAQHSQRDDPCRDAVLQALAILEDGTGFDFARALKELQEHLRHFPSVMEQEVTYHDLVDWAQLWDHFCENYPSEQQTLSFFLQYMEISRKRPRQEQEFSETIHIETVGTLLSQGREYDILFIIGMSEGMLPYAPLVEREKEEEQMRLMLTMSKARRLLYFSYPKKRTRMQTEDAVEQQPSPYLERITFE